MKRVLGWLCSILLILAPVLSAFGEEIPALDSGERIAFFYVHASKDPDELCTARYVIRALRTKFTGRNVAINRTDNLNVFDSADNRTLQSLMDINYGLLNLKDEIIIQNQELLDDLASCTSDVWMIIPNGTMQVCDIAAKSQALMDQFAYLLNGNPLTRIHLVMIGGLTSEPKADTAIAGLVSDYPDRVEWIRIGPNFMVKNCSEDEKIHTGNYFLAALFGMPEDSILLAKPVDLISELSAVPSEQPADQTLQQTEGTRWTISLPENGNLVLLQRNIDAAAGDPTLKDSDGGDRQLEKYSLDPPSKNDKVYFSVALAASIPGGDYYLSGCVEDTRVYWYPDLGKLNPVFDMGEGEQWIWGEQTVTLTLGDTLARPEDFEIVFEQRNDDNSPSRKMVSYSSDNKWKMTLDIRQDMGVRNVQVTPAAKLCMRDGNLIWEWKGDAQTRELVSTPVSVRENYHQEPELLYYTEETGGEFRGKWADFFEFNPGEKYENIKLIRGATVPVEAVDLYNTDDEFTVKVRPGTGDSGNGSITLEYGDAARELDLVWKNTKDITEDTEISIDPRSAAVGTEFILSALISPENYTEWQEARDKLGGDAVFPGPETLQLTGMLGKGKEDSSAENPPDGALFTQKEAEGPYTAEICIPVPRDLDGSDDYIIRYSVSNGEDASSSAILQGELSVAVQNNPPKRNENYPDDNIKTQISLEGMPGSYEAKELLKEVFGTENLFELFEDAETDVIKIEVVVNPPDGLVQVNGENTEPLEADKWEISNPEANTNPETGKTVMVTGTTKPAMPWQEENRYTISLRAFDGAQWSDPVTTGVSVYSGYVRLAMYAAAGIALLLLILIIILAVRQIRKPRFTDISLRCYMSTDDNADRGREIMTKCQPSSMAYFGKKAVSLTDLLTLTRQPALSPETTEVTDDITLLPTKHGEVYVLFGKKAMERIGRHEKKDLITQNNVCRMRIDNQYIQIENVR